MRHALLALAALSLATTADAGVIYVRKGATGANNGTSWNDAFAELRDALPASAPNDELWIAQGTYTPATSNDSFVVNGRKLYGGFNGTETLLDQRNWATYTTILSGDILGDDVGFGGADNCKHVVRVTGASSHLEGVVVEGGVALGAADLGQGAAIYFDSHTSALDASFTNCVFRRNVARRGAGFLIASGFVRIQGCMFVANRVEGQGGLDGGAALYRTDTYCGYEMFHCTIVDNAATGVGTGVGTMLYDPQGSGGSAVSSILWSNPQPQILPDSVTADCCIEGPPSFGNINADPQFVNALQGDYRLLRTSPCVRLAGGFGPPLYARDLSGLRRGIGDPTVPPYVAIPGAADIGAYEYAPDCNGNLIPDYSEVEQGTVRDLNANALPDECEPIGTSICLGDGSGAACPCGNLGSGGRGCNNSSSTGGGRIYAIGLPLVSHDTVLLHVDGLGPTAPALFFQGNGLDLVGGSSGLPFGDGLRCVFGQILRLPIKNCVNGQASTGSGVPGDVKISILGAPVMPGTRYYQAWYRDSFPFCTPAFYNMTNAVQITWGP